MFIRGIDALATIENLPENTQDTSIGIFHRELRSKNDTLSMWHIDDITYLDDAMLSIILTRDRVDKGAFFVFDDDMINKHMIKYKPSDPGCIVPLIDSHAEHYNMYNIRLCNTKNVLNAYREALEKERLETSDDGVYIRDYSIDQINSIIKNALGNNKVNRKLLVGKIKDAVEALNAS